MALNCLGRNVQRMRSGCRHSPTSLGPSQCAPWQPAMPEAHRVGRSRKLLPTLLDLELARHIHKLHFQAPVWRAFLWRKPFCSRSDPFRPEPARRYGRCVFIPEFNATARTDVERSCLSIVVPRRHILDEATHAAHVLVRLATVHRSPTRVKGGARSRRRHHQILLRDSMVKRKMTAKEQQDVLDRDPKYQAMMAEKTRRRAELEAMFEKEEEPLVSALTAAGWPPAVRQCGKTRSVWDLVNTAEPYPNLLETLGDHVVRPYHFRVREGIARALADLNARGTRIPRVLMDELKKQVAPQTEPEDSYRVALINTLVSIGDSSLAEEVYQLLGDPRYKSVRTDLQRLAKKLKQPSRRSPKDK